MSNRKPDERSGHRKPKVSLAMTISQGLGDPKGKPKGLSDGQPVNILALLLDNLIMRSAVLRASYWILVNNVRRNPSIVESVSYGRHNPKERASQKSDK